MKLYLHPDIKLLFHLRYPLFDQLMTLHGKVFRQQKGRVTQCVVLNNKNYFIKQHNGVGWKEIIKNILQCRWPVVGAKNEWQALKKLHSLNMHVPQIAGYGSRGINPAKRQSFVLTEALTRTVSLEKLCINWSVSPPDFTFKCLLLREVARIASVLHTNGINHRDFYLCHFLLDVSCGLQYINASNLKLNLIDLHRAQIRSYVPNRWAIKDLAGLYFSSKEIGLTRNDLYRFIKIYRQHSLKNIFEKEIYFWKKIEKCGEKLFYDHKQQSA